MVNEEQKHSPQNFKDTPKQSDRAENGEKAESLFTPRFRSVAAMAGWDEEALLIASLVVEDTPDRDPESKHKKRSDSHFKTPPTNSRRKRRAPRKSPVSIHVAVLNLDEDETAKEESEKKKTQPEIDVIHVNNEKKIGDDELKGESSGVSSLSSGFPCLDRLREELSCAICLEICFEPSTTPCGHSFCKKCLRSAADKCGKRCPKCRQLISNGRSCTVNTVLWNTIQLLFPQEVETRKAAKALNSSPETDRKIPERGSYCNVRNRSVQALNTNSDSSEAERQNFGRGGIGRNLRNTSVGSSGILSRRDESARRRRGVASQDEDAALALRLQREEFMEAFRGGSDENDNNRSSSLSLARANLRAMASRAINIRSRGRPS